MPAVAETVVIVRKGLLAAVLVRCGNPIEFIVGVGPVAVGAVVGAGHVAVGSEAEAKRVKRGRVQYCGQRLEPALRRITERFDNVIAKGGGGIGTKTIVVDAGEQRAGMVGIRQAAGQAGEPCRLVVSIGEGRAEPVRG